MKLISRKALVAVAATTALTFSGLSAPAFAEGAGSSAPDTLSSTSETSTPVSPEVTTTPEKPSGSSSEDAKPGDIKDWIGVFTAIIGALSAAFVFAQKFMNN